MTTPSELLAIYSNQSQISSFYTDKLKKYSILSFAGDRDILSGEVDIGEILDEANEFLKDTGGLIYFPYGKYKLPNRSISLNPYVFLIGSEHLGLTDVNKYPTFLCYAGENDETTPQFKLDFATGMKGFIFSYPNQVDQTSSSPTPYGYTIATDTSKSYNIDNVYLENLMFRNSYNGINLTKAGRFNIRNIYGQPLKNGLYVDRILDIARAEHIHFWTFYTTPGQNLYNWIKANGTAYKIGRVDGASFLDWFAYGYNTGFELDDYGNSNPWVDFTNCVADVCNIPVQINKANKVNFINGALTTASLYRPCILTGSSIEGNVTFNGTELSGGSGLGAKISSTDGAIQFANVKWNSGSNGIKSYHLINESTCNVSITGCDIDIKKIAGGNTTTYNGKSFPTLDTDITPANINTAANWTAVGTGSSITQLADGIDMAINTNSGVYYTFPVPTGNIRQNVVVLEFDYSETSQTDKYMLFRIVRTDGNTSNEVVKIFTSSTFHIPSSKVRVPFWIGEFIDNLQFRFEARTYSGTNSIQLRNIKVYKTTPSNLTNSQIDTIIKPKYLVPARRDSEILEVKPNGKRKILYNSDPTTGDWIVGDEIELITPTATGYKGKVCTAAGTPGTWKGFGVIET